MIPLGSPFDDGNFYSPVVDVADVGSRAEEIWTSEPSVAGIELDTGVHERFLKELAPFMGDYDYPREAIPGQPGAFFDPNGTFERADSRLLFGLLRARRPRRFIEVGSGNSSLLVADVNRRFLGRSMAVTCIEPEPSSLLRAGLEGIERVCAQKVQSFDMAEFLRLEAGDVLFIDSSHVSKTGSDVNHLVFRVLPHLASGVIVHFHDIFLPRDYPYQWVVEEHRSWNEQYLVQALLMFSSRFRVEFGAAFASWALPDQLTSALGTDFDDAEPPWGGSLWLRVAPEAAPHETDR